LTISVCEDCKHFTYGCCKLEKRLVCVRSREKLLRQNALLANNTAPQGDNSIFPAVNPPPKTKHSRMHSESTKISSALNQPLNIVMLGASFAGLSIARAFLDTTLRQLRTTPNAPNYRLILISPSMHIYWNIDAPRALVALGLSSKMISSSRSNQASSATMGCRKLLSKGVPPRGTTMLVPSRLSFSAAQRRRSYTLNSALQVVPREGYRIIHSLQYQTHRGPRQYLTMLLSSRLDRPLTPTSSLHSSHTDTIAALMSIHSKLAAAKSIVVCGGETSGVETAGQLATYLNCSRRWPAGYLIANLKRIIILTSVACPPQR
jgi:hypothetical protein